MQSNQKAILKPLDIDTIYSEWSKTYNKEGKPDWSHIFPYYHEDIKFHDSIQKINGLIPFQAMCARLTKRCRSLHMEILNVTKNNNIIMFEWIMTMKFRIFPSTPMYGSSRLTIHENGQIIEQRDYYDIWGDINNGIPIYRRFYRWFMRAFFG
jgi:DNA modification methylase